MMKLPTPKRVTFSNGRRFYAKCKRVKRSSLPPTICIQKTYTPRGRRGGGRSNFKPKAVINIVWVKLSSWQCPKLPVDQPSNWEEPTRQKKKQKQKQKKKTQPPSKYFLCDSWTHNDSMRINHIRFIWKYHVHKTLAS